MLHRIAITGAAGYTGAVLIDRLQREPAFEYILAMDVRPMLPCGKMVFIPRDVGQPLGDVFAQHNIQAVVHLAYILRPGRDREAVRQVNVGGTLNVLQACLAGKVEQILDFSSTTVYGAHEDNPPLLTEESPCRPNRGFQYAEDKVVSEQLLHKFSLEHPEIAVTILRGCVAMGPKADNFISSTLSTSLLVAIKGFDPPMQFIHEDDLLDAMLVCLRKKAKGTYNVAGNGTVTWREMVRMAKRRCVTLPASLLYPITEGSWRVRLQNDSPSCGLDMIRYPWVASTEKIKRELGIGFRYTSKEALEAFLHAER